MKVLCIHQGYELYGSDRSFIDCVISLRDSMSEVDIDILLPREGPLSEKLRSLGFSVSCVDLFVLRRKNALRLLFLGWIVLPLKVLGAMKVIRGYDCIYINTSVVIDFIVALIFLRKKSLVHVREIPPAYLRFVLRLLFRATGAYFVFNSKATERSFKFAGDDRSVVCYNGYVGPSHSSPPTYDGDRPLRVLLAGRINAWKGHELLIEAMEMLPSAQRQRLSVRIVGEAFEGQPFKERLIAKIEGAGLRSVEVLPFAPDLAVHYLWSDVVVVPSTRPEPFGRVAIEAFSFARPVLAANHGGLTEIVSHETNGWLFAPRDKKALAAALVTAINSPDAIKKIAVAARECYISHFTIEAAVECMSAVFRSRFGRG